MAPEYEIRESSDFQKHYKKVLKKYRHSFDKDYSDVMLVIRKMMVIHGGEFIKIPNTKPIHGLGEGVKHPIVQTRIHIKEARDVCGRLIYLVDNEKSRLFLMDVYYKSERENPDRAIIAKAYYEYLELLEQEKNSVSS